MILLFITDLIRFLGVNHQLVIALSVGFIVWYLYRFIGLGRLVGSLVGQTVRYVMAVTAFAAVEIAFGWLDPGVIAADIGAAIDAVNGVIREYGGVLVRTGLDWLTGGG